MTRKLLFVLFPLLLLILVSGVNAQTATDSATKLKQQLQFLQEQKKAAVSKVKEEAKALIQAKRDEFKIKLQVIKDQKKKALALRIDAKLARVNENQTAKYAEVLVRLQEFLDKIKQSTTETDAQVLADAPLAQTAINIAKAAVEAQTAKSYTMTITDDSALKLNAGAVVSQLRLDLMAIYKQVLDAKQAVQKLNTDRHLIKKEASRSAEL